MRKKLCMRQKNVTLEKSVYDKIDENIKKLLSRPSLKSDTASGKIKQLFRKLNE